MRIFSVLCNYPMNISFISVQQTYSRTSKRPLVVRSGTLWSYGQRPYERTTKRPRTYDQRIFPVEKGVICPVIAIFKGSENRIFAGEWRDGWLFSRFWRVFRNQNVSDCSLFLPFCCQDCLGLLSGCSFPILDSTGLDKVDRAFMFSAYFEFVELMLKYGIISWYMYYGGYMNSHLNKSWHYPHK